MTAKQQVKAAYPDAFCYKCPSYGYFTCYVNSAGLRSSHRSTPFKAWAQMLQILKNERGLQAQA